MSEAMPKRRVLDRCHALLVALCSREADASADSLVAESLPDPEFTRKLLDLAIDHRVIGLTLAGLERHGGLADEDDDSRKLLRRLRHRATVYEVKRDHILQSLAAAGVRPVVLKGAAIAGTLYTEPVERDLADLDLLVRGNEYKPAVRALLAEGYVLPEALRAYRRHHFHLPLENRLRHWIEIHWALARPGAQFQLDSGVVIEQAVAIGRTDGPEIVAPRAEHMLLHIVLQNLQEGFTRLARMVDIDRIVAGTPEFDWELLVACAGRGNLGPSTALSLRLSQRLFGTPIDERAWNRLRPSPLARFHLAIARPVPALLTRQLSKIDTAKHLLQLWLVNGARNRFHVLRKMLSPEPRAVAVGKESPGLLHRLPRLGKLVVLHLLLYLSGAASLFNRTRRDQMRFWSSHASSSERL